MIKSMFNKKRLIIATIVFVVIIGIVITNVTLKSFLLDTKVLQLKFQSGIEYEAVNFGKDVLIINNEGIMAMNRAGNELWEIVCPATSPTVSVKDKKIMIADMNGKDINIYKEDKLSTTIKTEKEILSAKMNKNGCVAVATEEAGYKGMLTVYDKHGAEIFKWHSGTGYIGGMDISAGNKIAVAQIMTDREKVYSKIVSIDIKKNGKVVTHGECEGIVMDVLFRDNSSFVAVSDKGVYGFDKKGKKIYETGFGGRIVQSYNIENENNMVFAFDNGRNGTLIESYSGKGKCRGTYDANVEARSFDVNGECIALCTSDKLLKVTPEGKVKKEIKLSRDVKAVRIFGNRNRVVVIGGSSAELFRI